MQDDLRIVTRLSIMVNEDFYFSWALQEVAREPCCERPQWPTHSWNYDNTSQGIHINCTAKLYCTNNHLFFFFSLKLGITFLEQFTTKELKQFGNKKNIKSIVFYKNIK
ncbi:hypothetical protein RCL_jg4273.t1 [Rhizophagus clarus]|uniref:Uncharacterized protein n=1 Tax=Rhizophagus clarus TaxID=94130 RepID=A0A8H3KVS8_9GLOM|nr:hypothetical protein RCL_jg4273.t1 [Rhizophagus clarus]